MSGQEPVSNDKLSEYLDRGIRLRREGRLEESVSSLREAISRNPKSARAQHELGTTLARNKQWEEAVSAFEKAIEIDSDRGGIYEHLGDLLTRLSRWEKAYINYDRAIQQDPDQPRLYVKLGDMLLASGDEEKAMSAYRRAEVLGNRTSGEGKTPLPPQADCRELYLDLMKQCLTFLLWDARDGPLLEIRPSRPRETFHNLVHRLKRRFHPSSLKVRKAGLDWPAMALTMVGEARLNNLQRCVENVIDERVPGDLIEAGVWRGGVPIFMRAILKAHNIQDRMVWVADSFEGLPKPNVADYPADRGYDLSVWKSLAIPVAEVRANFEKFRLLDYRVRFLEGWFKDTLPHAPINQLAVMRLDADLYESTMDALTHLYPKLSPGGYVIIDDYRNAPPCRKAVDDYRKQHNISEKIVAVDWSAVYWQRT